MCSQTWLTNMSTKDLPPQSTDRIMTLYDISKAVEYMHVRSLVHGELQPSGFMWFPQQVSQPLLASHCAQCTCRHGRCLPC